MKQCEFCGKEFAIRHYHHKQRFCSLSCNTRYMHSLKDIQPMRLAKMSASKKNWWDDQSQLKEEFSKRMKSDNPMHDPEVYRKVVAAIRASGCRPLVRGGNGTGPTKAEWQLMRMFPEAQWNYPIKTGMKAGSGFPTCYKLDIAFPWIKLGIEADGATHNSPVRRAQDVKKVTFLSGLGWKVLRYSNRHILDFRKQIQILADVESTISTLMATQATPSSG